MLHAAICTPRQSSPIFSYRIRPAKVKFAILVLFLFGLCNYGWASGPASPSPAASTFRVVTPSNHAKLSALPVEIKLYFPVGPRTEQFSAELNGVDVTRRFGRWTHQFRRARFFRRHLKLGENSFIAHYGSAVAKVSFTVQQASGLPGSSEPQSNYVPIQTRIVSGDGSQISDYGVQVGGTTYFAPSTTFNGEPTTGGNGFQVLVLDRATLNMVSNTSFGTVDQYSVNLLGLLLDGSQLYSGCGEFGCLVVVQSFAGIGVAGQTNSLATALADIVGTVNIQNYAATTSYSLITSIDADLGANPGTGHERILCTSSPLVTNCGSATISGAMILDNFSSYAFAYPSRVTFSTTTAPNSASNTVTVGTAQYTSSSVPQGQGGLQLVVLDRQTLAPIYQSTFTPINADQLSNMDQTMNLYAEEYCGAGGACPLIIVSTVGNVSTPTDPNTLSQWELLALEMQQGAGATYSLFEQLSSGNDYFLMGSTLSSQDGVTFNQFPVLEASTVVSQAIEPANSQTPPSNVRGVLKQDNVSGYAPMLSNLTSSFNTSTVSLLGATALQAPVAWPYPQAGHPGQQNAYVYFGQQTCQCNDIRASYNNLNSPLSIWFTIVSNAQYQSNPNYSQNDFNLLQTQLKVELQYAQTIQNFEDNINALYTAQNSNVGLLLASDYAIVQQNLNVPPPPPNNGVLFGVLNGLGAAFSLASYVTPVGPAVQLAFDAGSVAMTIAATYTHNSNGPPALNQKGLLHTSYGNLASDSANNFADGQEVIGNFFDLILSDWGRMQALGQPLVQGTITWDSSVSGAVLASFDRSMRAQYLTSMMAGVFIIEHDLNIAEGAPPNNFQPACTFTEPISVNDISVWAFPSGPADQPPSPGNDGQNYDGYAFWNVPSCPNNAQLVNSQVLQPLFGPLNPNDPTQLGQYAPFFYINNVMQIPVFYPYSSPLPRKKEVSKVPH